MEEPSLSQNALVIKRCYGRPFALRVLYFVFCANVFVHHLSTKNAHSASVVSSTPACLAAFRTPSNTWGISSLPYRFGTSPDWRTLLTSSRKHSSLIYREEEGRKTNRSASGYRQSPVRAVGFRLKLCRISQGLSYLYRDPLRVSKIPRGAPTRHPSTNPPDGSRVYAGRLGFLRPPFGRYAS